MKKIIINPFNSNNIEIANKLSNYLNNLNIDNIIINNNSNQERLKIINNYNNNDVIVLTLDSINNENDIEIIYSLRDTDKLARIITDYLQNINGNVLKYYQLRDPNNTSKDYYYFINNPSNTENILISLGNNINFIKNTDLIGNAIANSLNDYIKNSNIYIIEKGDTLFSIANKFNITVDDLKSANNLTNNALIIGNELIIPKSKEITNEGLDEEESMYLNYKVLSGDTLYSIAKKYNTTVNDLIDINNLESNVLNLNQIIKIPTSTSSIDTNYNNYTVLKGDSLYSISKMFNTTVDDIKKINNLSNTNLSIGQVLKIPSKTGSNTETDNYITYIVKKGDSLYKIASNYQTSVNQIKLLNNLKDNNLSIGETLKIPKENINTNYQTYTVKSGDSLYQIAKKFNTTVNDIKNLNNLTTNNLSIGQILLIP